MGHFWWCGGWWLVDITVTVILGFASRRENNCIHVGEVPYMFVKWME